MKLTNTEVNLVRLLANSSTLTQTNIAKVAGVSQSMVSLIRSAKRRANS